MSGFCADAPSPIGIGALMAKLSETEDPPETVSRAGIASQGKQGGEGLKSGVNVQIEPVPQHSAAGSTEAVGSSGIAFRPQTKRKPTMPKTPKAWITSAKLML